MGDLLGLVAKRLGYGAVKVTLDPVDALFDDAASG